MTRYLLPVMFLLAACSSGKKEDAPLPFESIGSSSSQPGIGPTDGTPQGTPFTLPAGVRFVQRSWHPFNPDVSMLFGNANTFYADVSFVNDNDAPVTIELPAGLVLLNISGSDIQNGLLMDDVRATVPPRANNDDTLTMYLGVACLNEGSGVPWGDNQEPDTRHYPIAKGFYEPSVVTSDANLLRFISLLKGKNLRVQRHYDPQELFENDYIEPEWMNVYSTIQEMVWQITDSNGMDKEEIRELINKLEMYK